jgi:hypothetical protein
MVPLRVESNLSGIIKMCEYAINESLSLDILRQRLMQITQQLKLLKGGYSK